MNNESGFFYIKRMIHFRDYSKLLILLIYFFSIGKSINCKETRDDKDEKSIDMKDDINFVKDKYVDHLMKIPGVVGVYVGENDQKQPCITVMIKEQTEAITKEIPAKLDGYPVIIEVTGEIKPM